VIVCLIEISLNRKKIRTSKKTFEVNATIVGSMGLAGVTQSRARLAQEIDVDMIRKTYRPDRCSCVVELYYESVSFPDFCTNFTS
jgi:hypothetical protein